MKLLSLTLPALLMVAGVCVPAFGAEPVVEEHKAGPLEKVSTAKDKALPSWFSLGLEYRGRVENKLGIGFTKGHRDTYYLHRLRLNAGVRVNSKLRLAAQVQDSRVPGWETWPPPSSVRNTVELRFAHVDLTPARGWMVRAGRQPLKFGSSRFLSTSNWGNVGPAYDGALLSYSNNKMKVDGFASYKVRSVDGELDRFQTDRKLWGVYSTWLNVPKVSLLDVYALGVDNSTAVESFRTYGSRMVNRLSSHFDAEVEMALQEGNVAGDSLAAWGGHWVLGYRLKGSERSPRIYADYSYASGDADPHDGANHTLQQLYPTHKWATVDSFAWRNIHEPVLGITVQPAAKWFLEARVRSFWLADTNDCLYGLSGAAITCNPDASSSHVGEEFDVRAAYNLTRHLTLMLGGAHLWPGRYLKESTPGAPCNILYAMWEVRL